MYIFFGTFGETLHGQGENGFAHAVEFCCHMLLLPYVLYTLYIVRMHVLSTQTIFLSLNMGVNVQAVLTKGAMTICLRAMCLRTKALVLCVPGPTPLGRCVILKNKLIK
jgi:hypothetical protein